MDEKTKKELNQKFEDAKRSESELRAGAQKERFKQIKIDLRWWLLIKMVIIKGVIVERAEKEIKALLDELRSYGWDQKMINLKMLKDIRMEGNIEIVKD